MNKLSRSVIILTAIICVSPVTSTVAREFRLVRPAVIALRTGDEDKYRMNLSISKSDAITGTFVTTRLSEDGTRTTFEGYIRGRVKRTQGFNLVIADLYPSLPENYLLYSDDVVLFSVGKIRGQMYYSRSLKQYGIIGTLSTRKDNVAIEFRD